MTATVRTIREHEVKDRAEHEYLHYIQKQAEDHAEQNARSAESAAKARGEAL